MSTQGIDRQAIMSRALRHGFTLRQQPGGEMDLNEYVYAFAQEVFEAGRMAERAAPAPIQCETCNGRGEIGGFQGGAVPGYVTEACPDCAGAGHAKQQEAEESAAPTYSYSCDDETFHGTFASPEEAAAGYLNDMPDEESVEVGQNQRRTAHNYVGKYHIESLLEMVAESAYEECGDCAVSWLSDLSKDTEQIKELKQVIGDWIQRKDPPDFWHVHFIRRITRAELVASGHLDQPSEAGG